jgi:soluble lytic murein transglycosylase
VDWVEQIPFSETRTYVMRVAESVVIYRAKLRGSTGPVDILGELTGR